MGFSCLDCPHHGCNLPFYWAADKQGIGREKPLNDFLIKPQIRAEQRYYLPPVVIYSPDCCSGSPQQLSLGRGRCWGRERRPAGSGMLRGDAGAGATRPLARPPLPQLHWQGKVFTPSTLKPEENKENNLQKESSEWNS